MKEPIPAAYGCSADALLSLGLHSPAQYRASYPFSHMHQILQLVYRLVNESSICLEPLVFLSYRDLNRLWYRNS